MPRNFPPISSRYNNDLFDPPAPLLEVLLSVPMSSGGDIKVPALLDSGADISVIPQTVTQQLRLKYVDEISAAGYDGVLKKTFVYSVKIRIENFCDCVARVIASDENYVIIGRDLMNKWFVFLKGREGIFEIS